MAFELRSRLLLVVVCLVSTFGSMAAVPAATTTASASTFAYDGPVIARPHVDEFVVARTSPAQFSGLREGSAMPSQEARRASTTPSVTFVATNSAGGWDLPVGGGGKTIGGRW
jgi:hypothetical protein